MTSQINPNNIDGNYPIAGVSNNTQGMRDNFTNIKTNFQYAEDEIDDLQSKVLLKSPLTGTTLDNNMNDNLLYAVQLSDVSYKQVQIAATSGSITLDYSAGNYQTIAAAGNISLGFSNWPAAGTVGALHLTIVVSNTAYTLTLPAAVSVGITTIDGVSPGTAGVSNTITFAATGTYQYVFETADSGSTISIENTIRPSNTYSGVINITNTTPSTSKTTGALIVAGGVGIGANLNVGGDFTTYTNTGNVAFQALDTGLIQINIPTVAANTGGGVNIVGSASGNYVNLVNAGGMLHITGNDGTSARTIIDSFGSNASAGYSGVILRRGRGTAASPTAAQANDVVARIGATAYGNTGFITVSGNSAGSIDFVATENQTTANAGIKIEFYTTPTGSATRTLSANVTANVTTFPAAVSVTGNVTAGNVTTVGLMSTTGNVNGGNVIVSGLISAVGNIATVGNILLNDGGTMGYNSGSGGTVAQSGNKSGGVTLNKPSGEITMQNTNLAADTTVSFTLTNSTIGTRDLLLMNIVGGVATPGTYNLDANCTTGSAVVSVRNITGGTLGEAIVIRFAVIRGSVA